MSVGAVDERVGAWWFSPLALGRVAVLRTAVYLFVILDVVWARAWVVNHGDVPGPLYKPLLIGRLLPLPTPTPDVTMAIKVALLAAAVVALSGRLRRVAGWSVALLYLEWQVIAFSYGKVDHDRIGMIVALFVLPTVVGARWGERRATEEAGWAIRMVQVAVVATYFLSAFAKLRYGGLAWLDSATLLRAVLRRGTWLTDPLLDNPEVLHLSQYLLLAFELATPLLLVPGRVGRTMLAAAFAFHAVTFAAITIVFLPHVTCLLAFLPLERLPSPLAKIRSGGRLPLAARPAA